MKRPAVFFDRDNTLIANDGYLGDPQGVVLVAGAAEAIVKVRAMGFSTVTFSNQSGVARGMFAEEAIHRVNARLDELLQDHDRRAVIDRHEFCPFHPDAVVERYKLDSDLRKPKPGMIYQAADRLGLDLPRSWIIGDAPRDIEAGKAAGCRTILFNDPSLKPSSAASEELNVAADFTANSLEEAVGIIERNTTGTAQSQPLQQQPEPQPEPIAAPAEPLPQTVEAPIAAQVDPPAQIPVEVSPSTSTQPMPENHPPSTPAEVPANNESEADASPAPPRKLTFAERVKAGTYQPARAAGAAGGTPAEKPHRAALTSAEPVTRAPAIAKQHGVDEIAPVVRPTEPVPMSEQLEPLLQQILEELRKTREQPYDEFSVSKLLAGITQVLVLPTLFFAYLRHGIPAEAQLLLILAIFLQTLTISLLIMGKQR